MKFIGKNKKNFRGSDKNLMLKKLQLIKKI